MDERARGELQHKVIMTDRASLLVSGIEDIESFDDDTVVAYTVDGIMTVKGINFKINRLNVDIGELEIEGDIDSISYTDGRKGDKGGFWGKIFK